MIQGALFTPLKRVSTPSGDVLHALKVGAPGYVGFAEAYFSQIFEGATKSWRRHREVTLNLIVPVGAVRFVIHDARKDSVTQGAFEELRIGQDNYGRLTLRPGLWLAFQGIGPGTSTILDIIDREHDPSEAEKCPLETFAFAW